MNLIRVILFLSIISSLGCEPKKPAAPTSESPTQTPDPKVKIAYLEAELEVLEAMQVAVGVMVRESQKSTKKPGFDREKLVKDDSKKLAILFSGNNHAEREDCGCKKRPLGGLARRMTMIDLALAPENKRTEWWPKSPQSDTKWVVDSGDMFFKSPLASTGAPDARELSIYDSESVALAMKGLPYDAVNVGVMDLAFGIERAQALYGKAGIKPISANLFQNGKRVFEPFKIVEKDGVKVAFIGLLKTKPRAKDFYTSRKLSVEPAEEAYTKVRAELDGKADIVVVLSNLGLPDSERLVKNAQAKPDLVIVSNTNRMTKEPKFVDGVPLVEPMSRGKFFGRVDLLLNGDTIQFANAQRSANDIMTTYGRAWRNYLSARIRVNRAQREITETEYQISTREQLAGTNNSRAPSLESRLNKGKKREEVLLKNRVGSSVTLTKESMVVANAGNTEATPGDDFIDCQIAAVDIKVPEAKKIKALVDKREKKRPVKEGGHAGHGHEGHDH